MTNWKDPNAKEEPIIMNWNTLGAIIAKEGGVEVQQRQADGVLGAPVVYARAVQPMPPPIYFFSVLQNGLAGTGTFSQVQQFWTCAQIAEHARNLYLSYKPTPTNQVQVVVGRLILPGPCPPPTPPPGASYLCEPGLIIGLGTFGWNEAKAYPNALWLKCPAGT